MRQAACGWKCLNELTKAFEIGEKCININGHHFAGTIFSKPLNIKLVIFKFTRIE